MKTLNFKEIKNLTVNSTTYVKSNDLMDRFSFETDMEKLQAKLTNKNFFVLAFDKKLKSHVPTVDDLQLISEYTHDKKDLDEILDGKAQIISFMLFTLNGVDEDTELAGEDGKPLTTEQIFDFCNNPDNINVQLANEIIKKLSIFRIIFCRYFDAKSDKFDYKILIRSNHNMITLYKSELEKESK